MSNKCRYYRKKHSIQQINDLVEKYYNSSKYKSLFSEKTFDSEYKWRNDVIRHLDVDSCNRFFWSIEPVIKCKHCGNRLVCDEYSYGGKELGFKGFRKFCLDCEKSGIWRKHPRTKEERKNISDGLKSWAKTKDGKNYYNNKGKENSIFMLKFSKSKEGIKIRNDSKKKQSESIKRKIKDGSFTPNITNSWTHWEAKIKINGEIKKFRSSWEACFALCHPNLKYEVLRIPYNERIYIGDFYDEENKILYELKPRTTYNTQVKKITEVINYCQKVGIKFVWVNENNILKYVDSSKIKGYNRKQYNKMLKGIKYARIKN